MKIDDIRVDAKVINSGDWVEEFPDDGMKGARLKVRGIGNADFRRMDAKIRRDMASKKLGDDETFDAEDARVVDLLHKTVLLDWDGIFGSDGVTPIPYSSELALKWLTDPDYSRFREAVAYAGGIIATRRKAPEAQAEKN